MSGTGVTIRRSADAAWRAVAGEVVILNLTGKRLYGLDARGGAIWSMLDEELTLEQLAGRSSLTLAEAARFVDLLRAEGLVRVRGDLPSPPRGAVDPGAPAIAWVEEVTRAVGQCMHLSGQSEICTQFPQSS